MEVTMFTYIRFFFHVHKNAKKKEFTFPHFCLSLERRRRQTGSLACSSRLLRVICHAAVIYTSCIPDMLPPGERGERGIYIKRELKKWRVAHLSEADAAETPLKK